MDEEAHETHGDDDDRKCAQFRRVYNACLEALLEILACLEYLRDALFASKGWELLMERLRRHQVQLRVNICRLLLCCFVQLTPVPVGNEQAISSTESQSWNISLAARIVSHDCWPVMFPQNISKFGVQATQATLQLMSAIESTAMHDENMKRAVA